MHACASVKGYLSPDYQVSTTDWESCFLFHLESSRHIYISMLIYHKLCKMWRKERMQNKTLYDTEFSQGFSIMKAKEFHHYRNEGPRWGCICHGKERKPGMAGIGVGIDILPLEAWEFWTGWLQKIPLLRSGKFLHQFSTPLPPFIAYTTSKVEVNIAFWQSKH